MSDEIKRQLGELVSQAEQLLQQFEEAKASLQSTMTDIGDTVLSEMAGMITGDFTGSGRVGGYARRISRSALKAGRGRRLKDLETQTHTRVASWTSQVIAHLEGISSSSRLARPDSQKLVHRFVSSTSGVKASTKLERGIATLRTYMSYDLTKNDNTKTEPARIRGLVAGPSQQFEAFREVLNILKSSRNYVRVVDPYSDTTTLGALTNCPDSSHVQLLTCPLPSGKERASFELLAKKLMKDRPKTEIRYAPAQSIHDRFILSDGVAWHLGHSIKDIGNRLSAITRMSDSDGREVVSRFNQLWTQSESIQ